MALIFPPLLRSPVVLPLAAWLLTLLVLLAKASLPGRRSRALKPVVALVFATVLLMSLVWTSCGGGSGAANSPTASRRSSTNVSPPSQPARERDVLRREDLRDFATAPMQANNMRGVHTKEAKEWAGLRRLAKVAAKPPGRFKPDPGLEIEEPLFILDA